MAKRKQDEVLRMLLDSASDSDTCSDVSDESEFVDEDLLSCKVQCYVENCCRTLSIVSMDHSSGNSVTFFRAIGKYEIVILQLMTEFIKMMFEYFGRSVTFAHTNMTYLALFSVFSP